MDVEHVTSENKHELGEEQESLLIERQGKVLYAIAYENPLPHVRYLLAHNYADALRQAIKSRRSLGHVVGVAPAIGTYGKHEERKRIYCYG